MLEEKVSAVLNHDADVSLEVKGDLIIVVNDAKCGRIITHIEKSNLPLQFKVLVLFFSQSLSIQLSLFLDNRHIRTSIKIVLQKRTL